MKKIFSMLVVAAMLFLNAGAGLGQVFAPWTEQRYGQLYGQGNVETIKGQIEGVDKFLPAASQTTMATLTLRPEGGGQIIVHLGPQWFVDEQRIPLRLHETVEVTGSLLTYEGTVTMIASDINAGGKVYTFRDMKTGNPRWGSR
jgi:hypothetical protein